MVAGSVSEFIQGCSPYLLHVLAAKDHLQTKLVPAMNQLILYSQDVYKAVTHPQQFLFVCARVCVSMFSTQTSWGEQWVVGKDKSFN